MSVGKNNYIKTHPYQAELAEKVGLPEKRFLHAEIDAIIKCRSLDKAHRILVTRLGRSGRPLLAKPCEICMEAIRLSGIQNIEWSV